MADQWASGDLYAIIRLFWRKRPLKTRAPYLCTSQTHSGADVQDLCIGANHLVQNRQLLPKDRTICQCTLWAQRLQCCGYHIFAGVVQILISCKNEKNRCEVGVRVHPCASTRTSHQILSYLQLEQPPRRVGFMSSFSVSEFLTSSGPLLITDQLSSPGDFLLHQLLSDYVKSSPNGKCIIISTAQDLTRWKAISSRSVGPFLSSLIPFYILWDIGLQYSAEARARLDFVY